VINGKNKKNRDYTVGSSSSYNNITSNNRSSGQTGTSGSWQSYSTESNEQHRTHSTDYYEKLAFHRSFTGSIIHSQKIYYISNLLLGGLILSFYAVMAFTPHYPCLT
jgi:hypothetical protein